MMQRPPRFVQARGGLVPEIMEAEVHNPRLPTSGAGRLCDEEIWPCGEGFCYVTRETLCRPELLRGVGV